MSKQLEPQSRVAGGGGPHFSRFCSCLCLTAPSQFWVKGSEGTVQGSSVAVGPGKDSNGKGVLQRVEHLPPAHPASQRDLRRWCTVLLGLMVGNLVTSRSFQH